MGSRFLDSDFLKCRMLKGPNWILKDEEIFCIFSFSLCSPSYELGTESSVLLVFISTKSSA